MERTRKKDPATQKSLFTAFVPYGGNPATGHTVEQLAGSELVGKIYLLTPGNEPVPFKGCSPLRVQSLNAGSTMKKIAAKTTTPYALLVLHDLAIEFGRFALDRMASVAGATGEGMVYSDYLESQGSSPVPHPLIDYQEGSIRDDFDFGSLVTLESSALKKGAKEIGNYRHAGFYALRLAIARKKGVFRIPETLYTKSEPDTRKEGVKLFDYVDPRNRAVQAEMEKAATHHLKRIGAWLKPGRPPVDLDEGEFPVTASIIIPVRNRANTVGDAVASALRQQASFPFNVIVVDNHSTDGTTDILRTFAQRDSRL
ncbi:MAG TPA: glycosyltransferase family A protein, partial [Bacteroidota bacterium]